MKEKHGPVDLPGYEEFVSYLRSALNYLYDPVQLRRSPLVTLLGLSGEFDRAAALQRLLTEAIQKLKPGENEPPQSPAWQIYDTLSLKYIRQFSRDTVANQLGISERQLRREQRTALEALAQQLWEIVQVTPGAIPQPQKATVQPEPGKNRVLNEELEWLESAAEQRAPMGEVLGMVMALAQPLAEKMQVNLILDIEPGLKDIPVKDQAMRHTLLTILSELISTTGSGRVHISAAWQEANITIRLAAHDRYPSAESAPARNGMDTAQRLAAFYGASLQVEPQGEDQVIQLTFNASGQIPVLVIDDNADWLEMLKRFVAGTRYKINDCREPETACALARAIQPVVIFLDVMMPGADGWQILDELRHDQATNSIPIVACTVLPLQELALSLGVNAFLQKPVTQEQFLSMLEKVTSSDWSYLPGSNRPPEKG